MLDGAKPFVRFGRGYHGEQFCEIILNLDKWFRRCCLKDFLYSFGGPFRWSRTIYANLIEGIIGNINMKLFLI